MNGDLILDKVNDPELRDEWHRHLNSVQKALKKMNEIRITSEKDPTQLQYFEAVLEYMEARDNERNFFWDKFVNKQTSDINLK